VDGPHRLPLSMRQALPGQALALLLAATVGLPIIFILLQWGSLGFGEQAIWQHLISTNLDRLAGNTLLLLGGVSLGVSLLGISLAWLVSLCDFPGRRLFDWALMLPLAIPGYVMAFVYLGLFTYAGPVQTALRQWFGSSAWFPDIRSAGGVVLVLSLVLYPYVYMLARAAFAMQGRHMMDAARILGLGPVPAFFKVALPVARPAIAGGLALALMETLADFGAVSVFNFDTFTTAIYKAWYGLFNLQVAAQLASLLLLFVVVTLLLEHYSRRQARYHDARQPNHRRYVLHGAARWGATLGCTLVLALAFLLPAGQLLAWVVDTGLAELDSRYLEFLWHTLLLAGLAAVAAMLCALVLGFSKRLAGGNGRCLRGSVRLATLGYALPGSVLAVGIVLVATWVDRSLLALGGVQLLLVGSLFALVLAYVTRFLAVAFAPVEAGLESIRPSLLDAARSLGATPWQLLRRIHIPMLKPGLLTALILVFVDVMKEMPATLIMRPFGWDTLAVRIYSMTAEGQWERAALPALTLLLAGLVPVLLLVRSAAGVRAQGH
jgi:iron(III) transport system permease protein